MKKVNKIFKIKREHIVSNLKKELIYYIYIYNFYNKIKENLI